ncbi:acyltransferase family protein [Aliikangiella sp. IMCC44653]
MRLKELDLLRFIAALSVVLFHYVAYFSVDFPKQRPILDSLEVITQFGFLGVPLFFMISGFVILASAMHRSNLDFAIARFARLYPVYWLCVSLTALIVFLVDHKPIDLPTYFVNMTMLQSFVGFADVDGVYWTLAKELQFYFCIFALLSLNLISHVKSWLSVWLVATITFTFFKQPFFMGWFITPEYSSFFIAGVCLYMLQQQRDLVFYNLVLVLSLLLSGYWIYRMSPEFLSHATQLEQSISVAIVAILYLIFWLIAAGKWTMSKTSSWMTLGALTYPLYLLHNILGKIALNYLAPLIGEELAVLLVTLIALYLSYCVYYYFERNVASPLKKYLINLNKFKGFGANSTPN